MQRMSLSLRELQTCVLLALQFAIEDIMGAYGMINCEPWPIPALHLCTLHGMRTPGGSGRVLHELARAQSLKLDKSLLQMWTRAPPGWTTS
jgi:hypothetical protein